MENREDEVDETRRSALKKIAVGAGFLAGCAVLPEQWTRPIVGQIVLPAHAATSGVTLHDPCTVTVTAGNQGTNSVTLHVTGYVTPPTNNVPIHIVATAIGGGGLSANIDTVTDANGNFSSFISVGGGPNISAVSVITTGTGVTGTATCSATLSALPALTPCAVTFNSGGPYTQNSETINILISGSVNPPTANVPIHIVWTTEGAGSPHDPIDLVTNGAGIYSVGVAPNEGSGYTKVIAVITSSGATGTTTCSLNVPPAT